MTRTFEGFCYRYKNERTPMKNLGLMLIYRYPTSSVVSCNPKLTKNKQTLELQLKTTHFNASEAKRPKVSSYLFKKKKKKQRVASLKSDLLDRTIIRLFGVREASMSKYRGLLF